MRAPQQVRSIASTERMLDAAEALLDRQGPDALTVDAVIRDSHASNGSFYARFRDRRGLMIALQERFHQRLDERGAEALAAAIVAKSLPEAVEILVDGFRETFETYRSSFNANLLHNRFDPVIRERGEEHRRKAARAIHWLITEQFGDWVTHPDPELAADFVFRTLSSMSIQRILFDGKDAKPVSADTWTREVTRILVGYLQPGLNASRHGNAPRPRPPGGPVPRRSLAAGGAHHRGAPQHLPARIERLHLEVRPAGRNAATGLEAGPAHF
ncbi:MAG: TetR/AcrR family transcriptional regulator [Streptosporangiaceae bacterium]|jgi:AcrR family transcriptional regulator